MELQHIQNKIYIIRNQKVMIDRDLAEIYGVETRVLNQAVKRNIERFPDDFMFRLNDYEFANWKSQIVISNSTNMGLRQKPYAFTELGVAMLSSVLSSKTAIRINMSIMRAFVTLRHAISNTQPDRTLRLESEINDLKTYLEEVFSDFNDINEDTRMQIELINITLAELQADRVRIIKPLRKIGFVNQE